MAPAVSAVLIHRRGHTVTKYRSRVGCRVTRSNCARLARAGRCQSAANTGACALASRHSNLAPPPVELTYRSELSQARHRHSRISGAVVDEVRFNGWIGELDPAPAAAEANAGWTRASSLQRSKWVAACRRITIEWPPCAPARQRLSVAHGCQRAIRRCRRARFV